MLQGRINVTPFDNGMYLYSMAHSNIHLSAVGFRSGSIHDPAGFSGMNHIVEHLVSRRSLKHTGRETDRIYNRYMGGSHGPDINVRCDRSSVLYGHGDMRRREYMWKCFDLYANMVKDAIGDAYGTGPQIFDNESLSIERAAVHNEYRLRGTDLIEDYIYEMVHQHIYKTNPAGKRVDCSRKDLLSLNNLEPVRQFIRDRYTTETLFSILIGPDNNQAVEKAREYFGSLPVRSPAPLMYDCSDDIPIMDSVRSVEISRPGISQHHIAIAFPTEGYKSRDACTLNVLAAILEYRIEQRLREENQNINAGIYHADVWTPRTFVSGLIAAWFPTIGDIGYAERATAIAIEECEKLKSDESLKFNEDCQDRCGYLSDSYSEMLRWYPLDLCEAIVDATSNGDPDLKHLNSYLRNLSHITPQRVREAARKYFNTDRFLRVILKPMRVPQDVIERATEEVRPYLLAINRDLGDSTD